MLLVIQIEQANASVMSVITVYIDPSATTSVHQQSTGVPATPTTSLSCLYGECSHTECHIQGERGISPSSSNSSPLKFVHSWQFYITVY